MTRIAWRTVLAHRVRLLLTALSAVLGVAFVTGMLMLTASLDRTFTAIFESTAQDILITRQSALDDPSAAADGGDAEPTTSDSGEVALGRFIPADAVTAVTAVEGVSTAAGTATGAGVYLLDAAGEPVGSNGPPALGLTWLDEPELAKAVVASGRAPQRSGEIVVDEITFPKLGIPLDSDVEIVAPTGRIEATVVGSFNLGESGGLAGATLTAFVPEQAQELLAAPGYWTSIEVAVADGFSDEEVAAGVVAAVGPGYEVRTRAEQIERSTTALSEGLGFFTTILVGFGGIALMVSAFLIFNTFAMLVARRGRELALLRAVGATRSQVLVAVIIEALVVAVVAAVAGVALGYVLANVLKAGLGAIGLTLSSGISLTAEAVAWAVGLGFVVTLASATIPAWRGSRTPPVAALRTSEAPAAGVGRVRTAVGLLLLAAAVWGLRAALDGDLDSGQTAIASIALLVAGILLAPALATAFAAATTGLLSVVGGAAGRIAGRNAGRTPARVAATAAALMIGLALVSGVTVIVASAQQSISDLVDRTFIGDVVVAMENRRGFSPQIADAIREVPGVGVALSITEGPADLDGQRIRVTALGGGAAEQEFAQAVAGQSAGDLLSGRAVATRSFAAEQDIGTGDRLTLLLPSGGSMTVRLAAIVEDNPLLEGLLVPVEDYRAQGGERQDRSVFVAYDGTVDDAAVTAAIEDVIAVNPLLAVLDQNEVKEQNAAQLDQLLYLVYAMLGLSVVIAALGVVNTMALSVVERTRELGLLRAVGASRRQVRRMVRWEAVLVSALGGALGVVVGVAAGAALRRSLQDSGIDVLVVPRTSLAWVFAAAILIGVLGAILPARNAARLDILRAIAAE